MAEIGLCLSTVSALERSSGRTAPTSQAALSEAGSGIFPLLPTLLGSNASTARLLTLAVTESGMQGLCSLY